MKRRKKFNIYCDEACHLEQDGASVMVLGCTWCPIDRVEAISRRVRDIKTAHDLVRAEDYRPPNTPYEIKWTKVSASRVDFYTDLVDAFFDEHELHFRGILVPDKTILDHANHDQTHDDWYYKMMFLLVDRIVNPDHRYRVYLDIKDTRSEEKRSKLEDVLRNANRDLAGQVIERVQQIRSHESELMQLADFFIGAITYHNRWHSGDLRGKKPNHGKLEVIRRIQRRSGCSLTTSTWQGQRKLNLLRWEPRTGEGGL